MSPSLNTKNVSFLLATAATTVISNTTRNRGSIDTRKTYIKTTCHLLLFSLVKSSVTISVTTQELFSVMKTRQYPKLETGGGVLGLILDGYVPLAS